MKSSQRWQQAPDPRYLSKRTPPPCSRDT